MGQENPLIISEEDKESFERMIRALEESIDVYTEINLNTMQYRQMNLKHSENYIAQPQGDYPAAFELMCSEEIHPDDVSRVREVVSPEALRASAHKVDSVSVRYRLRHVSQYTVMESKIYFICEGGVDFAISIVMDVTEETVSAEKKEIQDRILNNIESGIINIEYTRGNFRVVAANSKICSMSGFTEAEIFGMDEETFISVVPERDREAFREMLTSLKVSECKRELEYRLYNQSTNQTLWLYTLGNSIQQKNDVISVFFTLFDITKSKEQQLAFARSQKAIHLAQKRGNIAIWIYHIDEKEITQQSPEDEAGSMGYSVHIHNVPESFIQSKSVHPDDIDQFLEAYRKLDNNEESVDLVYRLKNQETGQFDWIHMYYQRMYTESTQRVALGFSVLVNEQQKQMERYRSELQLRKHNFADADFTVEVDLTQETIIEMTASSASFTNVAYWNGKSFSEYYDYVISLAEEEYRKEIEKLSAKNILTMFQNGETRIVIEFLGRGTKDSPLLYYQSNAYIVTNPFNGHITAFIYTKNIDDEVKHRQAIESSLEEGIESIALIRASDGQARIIKTSRSMKYKEAGRRFVYDDDFVRQSSEGVILEERELDIKRGMLSTVIQELSEKDTYEYRISLSEKTNGFQKMLFRFKYLDARREEIVFSILDITSIFVEEQMKSMQLRKALEDAKRANDVTQQFLSRMSHDMRTPMNGILGVAELSRDTDDPEELKRNITMIEDSGKYLLSLINDTLDYQKIQSGKLTLNPTVVDAKALINNIVQMVRATAEKKEIQFELKLNNIDTDWYIRADEIRLKQIFINLLSNAIKFTPSGGRVEWELMLLSREGMISHDLMIVRDTGTGMSKEFLENNIFQPFSQEHNDYTNQYAGSGLGLSIVKNLVELMGGHIEVESELGEGSTFKIYLDFERTEKISEAKMFEQEEQIEKAKGQLKDKSILLVEDHPLNAEIAKRLLEREGCKVTWVRDGKKGADAFYSSEAGQYDAILMDVRMPVMDGLEATKAIRALQRADAAVIPIIAMTANAFDEDVKNCRLAGMNAHIGKPIETKVLYETLAKYV